MLEDPLLIVNIRNGELPHKKFTRSMIKKGSLTHNRYYSIKGLKRRTDYESTIKKRIHRSYFLTL
jgi:hypothetical protein